MEMENGDHRRGRAVLGVNVGHPIVTSGDFVVILSREGVDLALPKLLWDFLLHFLQRGAVWAVKHLTQSTLSLTLSL